MYSKGMHVAVKSVSICLIKLQGCIGVYVASRYTIYNKLLPSKQNNAKRYVKQKNAGSYEKWKC